MGKPSDSDRQDDSGTIAEETIDVAELVGPPGLAAPMHDPPPKDGKGRVDWARLHALLTAVEALVAAGMTSEARPLLGQLWGIVEAGRGPLPLQALVQGLDDACGS